MNKLERLETLQESKIGNSVTINGGKRIVSGGASIGINGVSNIYWKVGAHLNTKVIFEVLWKR